MYVDVDYCYRQRVSVCLSLTIVSPAKTAEPIKMPFGLWTRMGPRNHVLDRGLDPPWERAIFRGKRRPIVKWEYRPCAAAMRPFVKLVWSLVVFTIGLIICVYLPGILGTQKRIEKAWLMARNRIHRGWVWEGLGPPRKKGIFRSKWRILVNFQQYFWATVCKTVRCMLSDRCPACVCSAGVPRPNGWMD